MPSLVPPKKAKQPVPKEMTSNALKRKHAESAPVDASRDGLVAKKNKRGTTGGSQVRSSAIVTKQTT